MGKLGGFGGPADCACSDRRARSLNVELSRRPEDIQLPRDIDSKFANAPIRPRKSIPWRHSVSRVVGKALRETRGTMNSLTHSCGRTTVAPNRCKCCYIVINIWITIAIQTEDYLFWLNRGYKNDWMINSKFNNRCSYGRSYWLP